MKRAAASLVAAGLLVIACSGNDGSDVVASPDGGTPELTFGDPVPSPPARGADAGKTPDGSVAPGEVGVPADVPPHATRVVSFTPGKCAGFGAAQMPEIVLGPPQGAGNSAGSFDVVSLGRGGEIILSLEPNAIVDGEGTDFIVFENAFVASGSIDVFAEPGEVSVSDDGVSWKTFPCTATAAPWGSCAGWRPVMKDGTGGDPFDLADVGLARARFVRIVDKTTGGLCNSQGPTNYGFDLDAITAVHVTRP